MKVHGFVKISLKTPITKEKFADILPDSDTTFSLLFRIQTLRMAFKSEIIFNEIRHCVSEIPHKSDTPTFPIRRECGNISPSVNRALKARSG